MIKFFRKIRQKLLNENKFSKYLIYAIGEIVLVVVGILIALSINNWNENQKNTERELQFLENFKKDILINKNELNRIINKTKRTGLALDSILKLQSGELEDFKIDIFADLVMTGGNFVTYKTQEGTIQDVLGSGALNIIKNDGIRFAIGSWKDNLKEIREWEQNSINSRQEYMKYLNYHIDIYKLDSQKLPINSKIKKELLNDRLFLNNISNRVFHSRRLNELYKKELPKLDTLISQINKELEF